MFEYQDEGTAWLATKDRALLGDEPGLGKTRQLLRAATGATLVVAPAMLDGVWLDEIAKWNPGLDVTFASYSKLAVRKPDSDGKRTVTYALRPEWRKHWDTAIFDEAHYLKGRSTAWAKAGLKVKADRWWMATGTPLPGWANEACMLGRALWPGDPRFTNYWRWVERWFPVWEPKWGGKKIGQKLRSDRTWDEFHDDLFGDRYLGRGWDDVGHQLPPLREQVVELDMVPAQRRAYNEMRDDFLAEIEGAGDVVAWSSGSREAALIKLTTGLELFGGKGSAKLDAVDQLVAKDWRGLPTIVACHMRDSARIVDERLRKRKVKTILATGDDSPAQRFAKAKAFQDGQGDVLVCTIESVAEGLTLTRAHRLVFVERSYRPHYNKQLIRRIWRLSQESPCLVVNLQCRDSIDQRREALIEGKTDQQVRALRKRDLRLAV